MFVTIPSGLLRDILGRAHPRALLLALAEGEDPVRYSEARRELEMHPQQFQRALDALEDAGLLGLQAPDDLNRHDADRDYYVFLELTSIGRFCVALWERINEDYAALRQAHGIPDEALGASVGGA